MENISKPEISSKTTGERIGFYRHARKLTQEKLAHEVGISQSVLSDFEHDKTSPTVNQIQKFAKVLNIPTYELMPEDEIKQTNNNYGEKATNNNILNNYGKIENSERRAFELALEAKDETIGTKDAMIFFLQEELKKNKK